MRFSIFNAAGVKIGQAPTAQKACDIAMHCTVTQDTWGGRWPFNVWHGITGGMLAEPYETHAQAFAAVEKLKD